jgi:mannose-6-phosphate isomerase-like protein (cupin superfamily)
MSISVIQTMDVAPERMEERDGWAISEFRLPITGDTGSATTVFHSIFRPGSTHAKHLHEVSDEIAVYLSGYGVVGQGESRAVVSAGHCRLMPKGSEHFFYNETTDEDAKVIGFYINAPSVAGTGYQFCATVTPDDLTCERGGLSEGILVHLKNTAPEGMLPDAWAAADVKAPIGAHNGSENSLLHVSLAPGGALEEHALANAEAIYYVASGNGIASDANGASDIGEDSFVFVPRGEYHTIRNSSDTALELYVVLTGAGSLSAAA